MITWADIEQNWLQGNAIGIPPEEVVAAFATVERVLGRDHVDSYRAREGAVISGRWPTLCVVDLGQRLMSLDRVVNASKLIEKLKARLASAYAELTAIHLLHDHDLEIEHEPEVDVGGTLKRPDFRARKPGSPWLYVEVSQPDVSEAQREIESRQAPFFSLLTIPKPFAIEIYFRRAPTDEEVRQFMTRATELCQRGDNLMLVEEVCTAGFLLLNQAPPGAVVLDDPPGEPQRPMVSAAAGRIESGKPLRQVVVRIAYCDERAENLLQREAKQLPKEAPGIVMFQISRAPGGRKAWPPLLQRRLQPTVNTRVSAIGMFDSGHESLTSGEAVIHRVTLLVNQHARQPLPEWTTKRLERFPEWKAADENGSA